jgi:UDP-apiose/xylose synthase
MFPERIAVLGAGGFLGSHLVPALVERFGCPIDAVDVNFRKLETSSPLVRRLVARVEHPGVVEEITSRCQVVLSLTALCNPALYNTVPLDVIDANYTHLLPWVKRCAERGVRLVHFSTSEVYGRMALHTSGRRTPEMNEEETGLFLGPVDCERWTYACAKQLLERVIWARGRHGDLSFTIVRLFNVIGPRMDFLPGEDGEGTPRVLAAFMNALLRGEELPLVDGGRHRRTFMSTADLVEALLRVVERPEECRGQILNLGNPANDVSIRELGERLAGEFAARVPEAAAARFRDVPADELYGPGYDDSEERVPDIGKARALLGWEPRESLADMLPAIVDDYVVRYGSLLAPMGPPLAMCSGSR